MSGTEMLKYEEHEAPLDADKWMANSTLPVKAFFARECQRLERLVYMPVLGTNGVLEYYFRVNNAVEEADLLAVEDEEWGSDHDVDPDHIEDEQHAEWVSNEDEDSDNIMTLSRN
ncbi:hypothetical protein K431DRAFT_298353 [Polychaeton citri CBS 116435]|uniref:Uncharacterized protein n=1 Tax=Polychaeton citri CBS 116435 TaxID=1314669 RepID=A0A9P4PXL8_9PEZI|nr:hypothetical protein K431DRAFT_298353 [Polychaeton citri CBS 116435]